MSERPPRTRTSTRGRVRRVGVSWLDVKLGVRMLLRHPGLTLVAVFALSIGIPTSLVPLHVIDALGAELPFEEADRIVGIQARDIATRRTQVRILHDFHVWKEELTSFEALAAARTDPYNVISEDGRAAPIRGSEITASAFGILRVPPLLGRPLLPSDEVPGAPDVVVLSHDVWQSRLAGDPDAVGATIRIGTAPHEVVGVMPEGFLFPLNDRLWLPLRDRPTEYERGLGPDVIVFGRLTDGVSIDDAQAELATVGARLSAEFPATNEWLRPEVRPYTAMMTGIDPSDRAEIYFVQLLAFTLLAIVCGNVGTLILARTSTRAGEIAVRTALGASRSRIVTQLFVEALVLAVVSAGIGLLIGDAVGNAFAARAFLEAPFWFDLGVKPRTVAVALGVAASCAVVAGVVPALKSTGRHVQQSLAGARAGSAMRFGGISSALIVAEVALAIGFLTAGGTLSQGLVATAATRSEIESEEYAMGMIRIPWTDHGALENDLRVEGFRTQVVATHQALLRRLRAEPGVRGVALASRLPGMVHPGRMVEVDGQSQTEDFRGHRARQALVDVGYFRGLGVPIQSGRDFDSGDLVGTPGESRTAVIVNTAFVDRVLSGRNPIGQRVRYVVPDDQEPGPWYEIVGVVGYLGVSEGEPGSDEATYLPVAPGELHPMWVAVRVGSDPVGFIPRLRQIASEVDPQAMVQFPNALSDAPNGEREAFRYGSMLLGFLATVAIVLSGAGLYALMSFTVSRRTREIGVRTALGARPGRIFVAVARRAILQLVAGTAIGVAAGVWFVTEAAGDASNYSVDPALVLAVCAAFMFVVGMLACVGPTMRALRIRPVEALREA